MIEIFFPEGWRMDQVAQWFREREYPMMGVPVRHSVSPITREEIADIVSGKLSTQEALAKKSPGVVMRLLSKWL